MTTRKKTANNVPTHSGTVAKDPKSLTIFALPTETAAQARAHAPLLPTVQAALTIREYTRSFGEVDIDTTIADLRAQCDLVDKGDLHRAEAMLTAQAHSLDAIFNNLARRVQTFQELDAIDRILRLALKAQSQSRATLETLAAIKNPPVVFAKQANFANGAQQVNNGVASEPARAEEKTIEPTELLERDNGKQWLDAGTASKAGSGDPVMVSLEEIHRPEKQSRKSSSKP